MPLERTEIGQGEEQRGVDRLELFIFKLRNALGAAICLFVGHLPGPKSNATLKKGGIVQKMWVCQCRRCLKLFYGMGWTK